jgi:hypothetical protein
MGRQVNRAAGDGDVAVAGSLVLYRLAGFIRLVPG